MKRNVSRIEEIPGWTEPRQIELLAEWASHCQTVVEIGVYQGKTSLIMGAKCPGVVYCIDSWDVGDGHFYERESDLDVYHHFLEYAIQFGMLGTKVIPIACPSQLAWRLFLDRKIDLIYIDGSHEYSDVQKDISLWYPLLSQNGIMCGDDWPMPSVKLATQEFANAHQLRIEILIDGKMWVYRQT